ncbi:hypothetical protein [Streptomyces sp. NPDC001123]
MLQIHVTMLTGDAAAGNTCPGRAEARPGQAVNPDRYAAVPPE